jgi:DNA-binding transcriptional LysR family regulator
MARSPLSAAIRQPEQEIGAELLARSSRGVTLTPAGEALLERARRILEAVDGAVAAARRVAGSRPASWARCGSASAGVPGSGRFPRWPRGSRRGIPTSRW